MSTAVIRRLGRPGDLGWVIKAHGEIYAHEFGWDGSFEGGVTANTGVGAVESLGIVGFRRTASLVVNRGTTTSYARARAATAAARSSPSGRARSGRSPYLKRAIAIAHGPP